MFKVAHIQNSRNSRYPKQPMSKQSDIQSSKCPELQISKAAIEWVAGVEGQELAGLALCN
jgi:hypothetical protein